MFGPMNGREIVSQHVHLPSLTLMSGNEIDIPKLGNPDAIRHPIERLEPHVFLPFAECPSRRSPFAYTAVMRSFCN